MPLVSSDSFTSKGSSYKTLVVRVGISVLLLYIVTFNVDWHSLFEIGTRLSISALLTCFAINILQNVLAAHRWWLIIVKLPGEGIPFLQATKLLFISALFNQLVLSSVGGDVARIWLA